MNQLTKNTIRKIIRQKWSDITVESFRSFDRGYTAIPNYFITTLNPKKEIVLRFKNKSKNLNIEKKASILLKKTSVPVPKIYFKNTKNMFEGKYYSIIEKIKGVHFDEGIKKLSKKQIEQIAYQLGNYIGQIHSIRNQKYGKLTNDKSSFGIYDTFYEYYMWRINGVISDAKKAKLDPKIITDFINFIELHKKIIKFNKKASLTHYDLYSDNIIMDVDSEKITGIIDWEGARWSDNELDLVKIKWWIFSLSKYIEKPFFKGYTKHRKLTKQFKLKMKFYEIIEAMAYAAWGKIINRKELVDEFMPLLKRELK